MSLRWSSNFQLLVVILLTLGVVWPWSASAAESVCRQCHGGQPGRLGQPVADWQGSIHQQNGIDCQQCHGGDATDFAAAMSPARGFLGVPSEDDIPDFCGRCHVGVLEDYGASLHGAALGSGGPQCVTCHGSHAVRKADLSLINPQDCSRCHDYGRAEEIKTAMVKTDQMAADLDAALLVLHRQGIDTRSLTGEVFAIRNAFHRLFHSVDVDRVRQQTAAFQSDLQQVGDEVETIEEQLARRKYAGGAVVVLLLLAGAVLLLLRRTYQEEEGA